ncbi:MAG: glycosyltransferase family 2 protein [Pseudomonadota bacterium]
MPKFSIIIPTTRAHYLPYSLRSALNQDYDDYEVIVVDNQAEGADAVVREFADPKVSCVHTPEKLAMSYNWEFGLRHAKGEYITFLGDDDVFIPQLLSTVADAITQYPSVNIFNWKWGSYIYPSFPVPELRNQLTWSDSSDGLYKVESAEVLRDFYNPVDIYRYSERKRLLPSIFHACCHRQIIETAQEKGGKFFFPSCPDFSSAFVSLAFSEEEVLIDKPMVIYSSSFDSNGVCMVGERGKIDDFLKEYKDEIYRTTPLQTRKVTHNGIADTMLITQAAFPAELGSFEFGWVSYFNCCYREIVILEENGLDMSEDRREFEKVLAGQPDDIRFEVQQWIINQGSMTTGKQSRVRRVARYVQDKFPALRRFRQKMNSMRTSSRSRPAGVIDAREKGLDSIYDCSVYVGKVIRGQA